jgi:hypothetical protein
MIKITVLCVVVTGCDTWYVILREYHRLRVFGKRVLRNIYGTNG